MYSTVLVMFSILVNTYWILALIIISSALPLSTIMLYKTHTYLEDMYFYSSSISSLLSLLTLSLLLLILLISKENKENYFVFLQVFLAIFLVLCFNSWNLLSFYVFFEACLIPILLMIISWGYQPERLQAGLYMIIYTVFSSMPLLVLILYFFGTYSTLNLYTLGSIMSYPTNIMLLGVLAFLVKLPIYSVHLWLPKAHVEAPLGGSMILAGVLLKLGGYGLYVYLSLVCHSNLTYMVLLIISISMWGGLLASLACMLQNDIKAFIAYSSVVHMSVLVLGLMSGTSWGQVASFIVMLSHGGISSLLFLLALLTYKIFGSRSFSYSKGLLTVFPLVGFFWFLAGAFNMGFPPTLNFIGEFLMLPSIFMYSAAIFFSFMAMLFMSVLYNMYMYTQINHGAVSSYLLPKGPQKARDYLSIVGHFMPTMLLFKFMVMCK
uniref:NADH dehydrogenase subunit 4 n=1 Tax=Monacha cartusiana TaxID=225461 RepID=UPI0023D80A86|nr:NADH dehydrogenase subunit 4 [Monacha cartusiana]URP31091.1 NADH dehydrogenase subunit 4 [Monacha cartusiana]